MDPFYLVAASNNGPFLFNYNQNLTICTVQADPDIAGIGVVFGFLIGAFITTLASITAAVLDGILRNEHCILPRWLVALLPKAGTKEKGYQLWRDVLEKLILSFADQQLVTGFALLIAGYTKLYHRQDGRYCYWNAHFYLVVYLACLSSGTHLACLLTLRKYIRDHRTTGTARIILFVLFALFLTASVINVIVWPSTYWSASSYDWSTRTDVVVCILICLAILYIYWITLMQSASSEIRDRVLKIICSPIRRTIDFCRRCSGKKHHYHHARTTDEDLTGGTKAKDVLERIVGFLAFSSGSMVFLTQMICSGVSLAFVCVQKFSLVAPGAEDMLTSLNNPAENEWGFGQIVALILLALPFLNALELYREEKDELHEQELKMQEELRQKEAGFTYRVWEC